MSKWWLLGIGVAAAGVGFYAGAKYALNQVQAGVVGKADSLLTSIGLDPSTSRYGAAAHTIIDATVGEALS